MNSAIKMTSLLAICRFQQHTTSIYNFQTYQSPLSDFCKTHFSSIGEDVLVAQQPIDEDIVHKVQNKEEKI